MKDLEYHTKQYESPKRSTVAFVDWLETFEVLERSNCRFVKQMLHKREKEKEPHEEISSRGGASGSCYTLCFVAQAAS